MKCVLLQSSKNLYLYLIFHLFQHADRLQKRQNRVMKITENLVKVAQTKCAAQHYATNISCHISTGSDMGNIGHGRKQFVDNSVLQKSGLIQKQLNFF